MKDASNGAYLALEDKHLDSPLLTVIRCCCNSKVASYFIITKNTRSVKKGNYYEMKFADSYSNFHLRLVNCSSVILDFFKNSNYIDKHNQAC